MKVENKIFDLVSKHKGYELFVNIMKIIKENEYEIQKEMAIVADNNLTDLMNIVNNAGWNKPETHSKTIDIIRKSSAIYAVYLEE